MITNYLSPVGFVVSIQRLPNVEFFTQRATIPGVNITPAPQAAPIHQLYAVGDRLEYQELDMNFIVDESMNNYNEILAWMEGIGTPEKSTQFRDLEKGDGTTSDIRIVISNSNKNPNIEFTFFDCFPTSLSPVSLDVTGTDVIYPECSVTFRYTRFEYRKM
jgi:hypothetical protein